MWRRTLVLAIVLGAACAGLAPRSASAQEMDNCYDLRMGNMGCIGVSSFNFSDPVLAENSRYVAWRAYVRNATPSVMTADPTNRPSAVILLSSILVPGAGQGVAAVVPDRYVPPGPMAPIIVPPSTSASSAAAVVMPPGVPSPRDEISVHGAYPLDSAGHDYCVVYSREC